MSATTLPSPMNRLPIGASELAAICERHHVRRLALFGSRARGDARPDSDLDLLVEFQPGARPNLLDLGMLEQELSQGMGGLRVDLRTVAELSRYFRDEVLSQSQVQYAAS